jgi:hypothetical protein
MIAADLTTIEIEAAERRRILARVYALLISLAEEMEEQALPQTSEASKGDESDAATSFEMCLSIPPENPEPKELPEPLKPNSPP